MTRNLYEPAIEDGKETPWYDSKQGIEKCSKRLALLHELILRRIDAKMNNESLHSFIVLGKYYLDDFGRIGLIQDENNVLKKFQIPNVLTFEEYIDFLKNTCKQQNPELLATIAIPVKNGLKCHYCKQYFNIQNANSILQDQGRIKVKSSKFIGKTLGDIMDIYESRKDAHYFIYQDHTVKNDKNIDLSPQYENPKNDYERRQVKNEHGYLDYSKGQVDEHYIVQEGDEILFYKIMYCHPECNRQHLKKVFQEKFRRIFVGAGFQMIKIHPIKNEYCDDDYCAPWFEITTEFGVIKIGWRNQVINIDWSRITSPVATRILSLFEKEEVTKDANHIHAWGWKRARLYIKKIYKILNR